MTPVAVERICHVATKPCLAARDRKFTLTYEPARSYVNTQRHGRPFQALFPLGDASASA